MKRLVIRPIVLTVLAVSLAGCQVTARDDSPITSGAAPLSVVLDLPSASQEIAVDSATNTLWVASVQTAGKDTLWSVDMTKGTSRAYDLPDVDYSGYTTHVRVGQDGAVWISLPYELARWDPTSGTVTSVRFSEDVDGALPGALDPNATLPGTWLSAILPDDAGVLVARNNVPYLTAVSPDLTVSRGLAAPDGYAGAADLLRESDGSILMLPALDNPAGEVTTINGSRIAGTDGLGPRRFLVDGPDISALVLDDSEVTVVGASGDLVGNRGSWARTNSSGTSVSYDASAGTLTREGPDGHAEVLQLERFEGEMSGGGIDPATGKTTNQGQSIQTWDRLTDFFVAEDGTVWLLRHKGTQLVRWNP